ncbi:MAG: hypothetical protein MAG581_00460 [Deltaproteobacteria bacterium]|jgi:hypothetical protein|nr:hypothetical protein [Deltaproteobacteria bacterium]
MDKSNDKKGYEDKPLERDYTFYYFFLIYTIFLLLISVN